MSIIKYRNKRKNSKPKKEGPFALLFHPDYPDSTNNTTRTAMTQMEKYSAKPVALYRLHAQILNHSSIIKLKHLEFWHSKVEKSKERNGQEHKNGTGQQFGISMGHWVKMVG